MIEQPIDPKVILQQAFPGIPAKEAQDMAAIGKVETYDFRHHPLPRGG